MTPPDYQRSIVNLMSAIGLGLGAEPGDYAPLAEMPRARLTDRPVVLWVIDGLGETTLSRFPDSALARHRIATLHSTFPSTTATAITSYTSGVGPQQHAITGWFTWLRELGSVATILPFFPRHGGESYAQQGITPQQIIGHGPLADRIRVPTEIVTPAYIVDSDYTRASAGQAQRHPHTTLEELVRTVTALAGSGEPRYILAYWTELDALAHQHGVASAQVDHHFAQLDRAFDTLRAALAGSGALLLVCADHGLLDTGARETIHLDDHPALAHCLTLPLCGEPRAAYAYVRSTRRRQFEDYLEGELDDRLQWVASEQLLAEGYFGLGTPHPRLWERIGDYVLLPRGRHIIKDRLPNERPFRMIGVHGGLSREEQEVPLILAET